MTAFPSAKLYAPPRLAERRKDLFFDSSLEDGVFGTEVRINYFPTFVTDEAVLYQAESKTVLFTQVLTNLSPKSVFNWRKLFSKPNDDDCIPSVPRLVRLLTRKKTARRTVSALLEQPLEHIVVACGACIKGAGQAHLQRAFNWLF